MPRFLTSCFQLGMAHSKLLHLDLGFALLLLEYIASGKNFSLFVESVREREKKVLRFASVFVTAGNTKGGSITVPLTSCLTGLVSAV
jgi:hypothetical protein